MLRSTGFHSYPLHHSFESPLKHAYSVLETQAVQFCYATSPTNFISKYRNIRTRIQYRCNITPPGRCANGYRFSPVAGFRTSMSRSASWGVSMMMLSKSNSLRESAC